MDNGLDCNTCPLQALEACDEICATKKSLADFGANMLARAEKAERERDALASYIVYFMCENCPKSDCANIIRDWAAKNAAKVEEKEEKELK